MCDATATATATGLASKFFVNSVILVGPTRFFGWQPLGLLTHGNMGIRLHPPLFQGMWAINCRFIMWNSLLNFKWPWWQPYVMDIAKLFLHLCCHTIPLTWPSWKVKKTWTFFLGGVIGKMLVPLGWYPRCFPYDWGGHSCFREAVDGAKRLPWSFALLWIQLHKRFQLGKNSRILTHPGYMVNISNLKWAGKLQNHSHSLTKWCPFFDDSSFQLIHAYKPTIFAL